MFTRLPTTLLAFALLTGCASEPPQRSVAAAAAPLASAPAADVATTADDNLNAVAWSQTAIEHDLLYVQTYRDAQAQ